MSSRLLRNGAIYSLANALSAGVPFFLLPLLTRALSPADYGQVISFFMLVSLSSSLAGMSVHGAVSVKWFKRDQLDLPRFVTSALCVALASTLACGGVLFGLAPLLQDRLDLPPPFWFLAAVQAGASVVIGVRTALWQSQGHAMAAAVIQVASAILNAGLSLIAVFVLSGGGPGRIFGSVAASVGMAGVSVWFLFRRADARAALSSSDLRELLRFGAPLVPYAIAGALMVTIDRFVVSAQLGREALGIYGTAAQLGMAMNVLGDAMNKALSPWLYGQLATRTTRGRLRVVGSTYVMVPAWIIIAFLGWLALKQLGQHVLEARYMPAIDLSIWFLLGGGVWAVYTAVANLYFFSAKTEWLSVAIGGTTVCACFVAPALTMGFGATGAAASYLCIQVVGLLLSWLLSTRAQPMPWGVAPLAIATLFKGRPAKWLRSGRRP